MSENAYGPRDWASHPPYLHEGYKSTILRSPRKPLVPMPQGLSELTGPVYGHEDVDPLEADLTRNGAKNGEPLGERIIVVGRVIDDKTITAQVKSKLVAEKASNLTRIGVTTVNAVVYLDGAVESVDHKVHAEELARRVEGVGNVVNNIQVSAAGSPPSSGSASPR